MLVWGPLLGLWALLMDAAQGEPVPATTCPRGLSWSSDLEKCMDCAVCQTQNKNDFCSTCEWRYPVHRYTQLVDSGRIRWGLSFVYYHRCHRVLRSLPAARKIHHSDRRDRRAFGSGVADRLKIFWSVTEKTKDDFNLGLPLTFPKDTRRMFFFPLCPGILGHSTFAHTVFWGVVGGVCDPLFWYTFQGEVTVIPFVKVHQLPRKIFAVLGGAAKGPFSEPRHQDLMPHIGVRFSDWGTAAGDLAAPKIPPILGALWQRTWQCIYCSPPSAEPLRVNLNVTGRFICI